MFGVLEFVKGRVSWIGDDHIVLETPLGLGVKIITHKRLLRQLRLSEPVTIYTRYYETARETFIVGFADKAERSLFNTLINIKGMGIRTALSLIGSYTIDELEDIVTSRDIKLLLAVPGVGKKLANRIITELSFIFTSDHRQKVDREKLLVAVEYLGKWGLTTSEAKKRLLQVWENNPDLSVEEAVRKVLELRAREIT